MTTIFILNLEFVCSEHSHLRREIKRGAKAEVVISDMIKTIDSIINYNFLLVAK